MIKEETYEIDICEHFRQIVNQGLWWCDLKNEDGKQKHPKCDCKNCPDKTEPYKATITYTTGETK